nr:ubiquitin carboxyl-terminal hydrolase 4 isoform X4 [Vicugna pacos]
MAEGGGYRERPDAETQKSELGALMRTTLQRGAQWYLIDSRWFKQWKKYVGFDSWDMYNVGEHNLFPGPIDNSGLFSDPESQTLKEHLIDELDYVLVPTEAWNKLLNWYGCVEGQQPIVRKVVEHGLFVKHCKVEVYLLELKLCENSDPTNVLSCHFSKADTIATIEKEMRKLFNIPAERETRLWNKYMSNTYEQLSKLDNTVQDAGLYQGQVLVIEPQNEDGTWPRQTLQSKSSTAPSRNFTTSLSLPDQALRLAEILLPLQNHQQVPIPQCLPLPLQMVIALTPLGCTVPVSAGVDLASLLRIIVRSPHRLTCNLGSADLETWGTPAS